MENKPFFIDEKELAALKKNIPEEKVEEEEPKVIKIFDNAAEEKLVEIKEENTLENNDLEKTSTKLTVTKPTDITEKEKTSGGPKFNMSLQMFCTIMASILVLFFLLSVARSFYYGFKYYDCAHITYDCNEETNTQK